MDSKIEEQLLEHSFAEQLEEFAGHQDHEGPVSEGFREFFNDRRVIFANRLLEALLP